MRAQSRAPVFRRAPRTAMRTSAARPSCCAPSIDQPARRSTYIRKANALHRSGRIEPPARLRFAGRSRRPLSRFYWDSVAPHVQRAIRHLNITSSGRQWIANLYSNVFAPSAGASRCRDRRNRRGLRTRGRASPDILRRPHRGRLEGRRPPAGPCILRDALRAPQDDGIPFSCTASAVEFGGMAQSRFPCLSQRRIRAQLHEQ